MKRPYTWIISFVILGLLIFGYWSISSRAFSAENALEASYQRGFYNLIDSVDNQNLLISKCMVTSSDAQRIMTLTTIWHQAEQARTNLAELPMGERDMTNSQKFFAQLGDFSYNLANKLVTKKTITDKEWKTLENYKKNTANLNRELRRLQDDVSAGRINWESRMFGVRKMKKLSTGMADNFASLDQKLKKEAPTIVYDGPFSDHVENVEPKNITGQPINETEAIEKAKSFIRVISKTKYNVKVTGKTKGKIPAYNIEFMHPNTSTPEIVMDMSQAGGHVLWFLNTRTIGSEKIELKKAVENARNFLTSIGYKGMEATGSLREDNTITITFVPRQDKILLYPDFVKTEVALDNGEIVGFDTIAHMTFHNTRNLPVPKLNEQDVRNNLNKNLEVSRIRLVLLPDSAFKEKLCYEVDAKLMDERYFIYINAINGDEERILKVVETEKGTMTM